MTHFATFVPFLGALGVAAAAAVVGYAFAVAPRRLCLTEHLVGLRRLPSAAAGMKVVQLTDFHFGRHCGRAVLRRIVELTMACEADLVVLTGDFVNFHGLHHLPPLAPELGLLTAPLGVFACLGNHDHWEDSEAICDALEAVGVRVLSNEGCRLANGLQLAAVTDLMAGEGDTAAALAGLDPGQATLFLSHNPTAIETLGHVETLVLSGHTHGGQIALPGLGPSRTPMLPGVRWLLSRYERLGPQIHGGRLEAVCTHRYPAGWYRRGRAQMYVSRGLGLNPACPVRLNCPPEIAVFTLASDVSASADRP